MGFRPIVEGIRSILGKTDAQQKYHHLAAALERLGYLTLPPDLADLIYPAPRPGLSAKLAAVTVPETDVPVEVLYVQPTKTEGDRCIDFEVFARHVARFDDPLSQRFAEHLLRWREAAGAVRPAR